MSKTGIICTIGPACNNESALKSMLTAGMNMARLNFSHGSHQSHQKIIDIIKKVNRRRTNKIKILQDLEGFRVRVGRFKGPRKYIHLQKGQIITMIKAEVTDRKMVIPFDYNKSLYHIKPGAEIFFDDGNLVLKVIQRRKDHLQTRVVVGGKLKENKGINIPNCDLKFDSLTEKDKKNIIFGIENKVDYIAQSFVRNKRDILEVKNFIEQNNYKCKLIAKIENSQGIENLEQIMGVCDGIMIARGDMGVSLPIYKVPMIQKKIISQCRKASKFVITATQMLESMTENLRPTRAEVSDVANAILDGTDYVMLSGETAAGKHPIQTVQMMQKIIDYTEQSFKEKQNVNF